MIQVICWMLIHSLWQGLIFTVATGLVMLCTKRKTAAIRYRLLSGLFFLFLAVCGMTFYREWMLSAGMRGDALLAAADMSGTTMNAAVAMRDYFSTHAASIVLGWFIIFIYKCARMTGSLIYTQRIRHYGTSPVPQVWLERLQVYCRQLGISGTVMLVESRLVKMPLTAGHWKPIIFVPLGLLTRLPAGEIEAMLLHELAHIRRHDYLVNFLQHIAENIFFFNPALLWMSALLRAEREHCCDDVAIAGTDNNRVQFLQALINCKEYDLRAAGLANAFAAGRNQLMQRALRIAHNRNKTLDSGEKIFFLGSILAIAMLVATAGRDNASNTVAHRQIWARQNIMAVTWTDLRPGYNELRDLMQTPAPQGQTENAGHAGMGGAGEKTWADEGGQREKMRTDEARQKRRLGPTARTAVSAADQASLGSEIAGSSTIETRSGATETKTVTNRTSPGLIRIESAITITKAVTRRREAAIPRTKAGSLQIVTADQEIEQPVAVMNDAHRDAEQAARDRVQAVRDREQAARDRDQAVKDAQQAEKDRAQAMLDKIQAEKDRVQADKDRVRAQRASAQARIDKAQAEKDRLQADEDRARADRDRIQADKYKEQADRDRKPTDKQRLQAVNDRRSSRV